jgi:anti-anti-sigma regulatory factor
MMPVDPATIAEFTAALAAAEAAAPADTHGRAAAQIALARALLTSDSARTLGLAEQAAALLADGGPPSLILAAATLQVQALYQLGRLAESLPIGQAGLAGVDDERPTQDMFGLLSRLTWVYADIGQFEAGLELNARALAMARRAQNRTWEALAYSDLGVVYSRWEKPTESHAATLRITAPEIFAALSGDDKALVCNNIAEVFLERGDAERALAYADEGLAAARTSFLLSCRATALAALGRDDQAEASYVEGVTLARAVRDFYDEQAALTGLARLLQRRSRSHEALARASEALAVVADAPTLRLPCLELLAELHASGGDYRQAYAHAQEAAAVRAAVYSAQADLRAQAIELRLRNEMAERESALARHEQQALRAQNQTLQQIVAERDQALDDQRRLVQTILEISTPVLPLPAGVLALPIIGSLDAHRAERMSEAALASVQRHSARALLIDITGVQLLELDVAASLLRIARAVRLLGCQVVLVGVRPEIAQSLVGLGADLGELITRASLADGLSAALGMAGWQIVRR